MKSTSNELNLELRPDNPGEPLFESLDKERQWNENFTETVAEKLKELPRPLWLRP